ncbi:hypothetical protein ATCCBAA256_31960, partial [Mycobacterium montefiorense]
VCGAAVVVGAAVVAGAALVCGGAVVSGACGLCGPPGPPWQLPFGHGGGSSGAELANPWLNINAEMLSPAATATALTRFLEDIAASPLGLGPR